jgi:hypothetical protein
MDSLQSWHGLAIFFLKFREIYLYIWRFLFYLEEKMGVPRSKHPEVEASQSRDIPK